VSNFVALLKDSSLAYAIGVVELTNVGNRIQSATFQPIATLTTVAITYLLLTTLVTQIPTPSSTASTWKAHDEPPPTQALHRGEHVCKSFGTHQVLKDVSTISTRARSR
jgi:hypothetical protein